MYLLRRKLAQARFACSECLHTQFTTRSELDQHMSETCVTVLQILLLLLTFFDQPWRGCPAVWSAKDAVLCRHECESVPPDPFSPLLCWLSDAPQFLLDSIERQRDSYLSELKDMLLRIRGKEASTQTIERTLKRAGFTLKEVCISGHLW